MSILSFVPAILEIINKVIPDPNERIRVAAEIQQAAVDAEARIMEAQSNVVVAEAQGESWMQRNWRPSLMYLLMFTLVWHMMFLPMIAAIAGVELGELVGLAEVPESVWTLLTVGMGGYIGGRSLEKVAKTLGGSK